MRIETQKPNGLKPLNAEVVRAAAVANAILDAVQNFSSARPACAPRDCRAALAKTLPCHCEERSDEAISRPQVPIFPRLQAVRDPALKVARACYASLRWMRWRMRLSRVVFPSRH